MVVFDLDPGPARDDRRVLRGGAAAAAAAGGRRAAPLAKTSGSKGLQLYARADAFGSAEETSAYAKGLRSGLEKEQPDLVVQRMTKSLRDGKVPGRLVAEQRGQDRRSASTRCAPAAAPGRRR
jgi:bifunctional non-homologous end joining protein LigD